MMAVIDATKIPWGASTEKGAYSLFVCTLVTCVSLVLAGIYRVPGLACACIVYSRGIFVCV